MTARHRPPDLARRLLALRFRPDVREVIEGDLAEYFARDLAAGRSRLRARLRYWRLAIGSVVSPRGPAARDSVPARRQRPSTFGDTARDARLAVRRLLASPGFTIPAIATLTLAIGVNAALFTALQRVVLSPLPFESGHRMAQIWRSSVQGSFLLSPTATDVERWRQLDDVFEWIEAYDGENVVLLGHGEPRELQAARISPELLARLGVTPAIGRPFTPSDADVSAEPALLLSDGLWRSQFGGDPSIVGRTIRLGDEIWRVAGVMPRRFWLPGIDHDLWLARRGPPPDRGLNALALVRDGVGLDTARAAVAAMPIVDDGTPTDWSGRLTMAGEMFGSSIRRTLSLLAWAVGLLLLMACVNVAGLVLSRHRRRQRELAMRMALGASRARLFRMLMVESVLLALAGGAAGLGAAHLALGAIGAVRPDNLTALEGLRPDGPVYLFTALAAGATALVFGVLPAWRAARWNVAGELAAGGRGASEGGLLGRGALGALQLGIALVLLAGSLLLTTSVARLAAVNPGFDSAGLVTARVALEAARYEAPEARALFVTRLLESVRAMPGVTAVAHGSGLPPSMGIVFGTPELEGVPADASAPEYFGGGWAGAGYFSTLGIPLLEGRAFNEDDERAGADVAIVSRSLARRLGGGESVIGRGIRMSREGDFRTIVGVAGDVAANGLRSESGYQLYTPVPPRTPQFMALAVRTRGEPAAAIAALKARIWAIDPELPIADLQTVADRLWRETASTRFALTLLGAFALAGLGLAAVGVFGTLTLLVSRRRREVAVRLSLGATPAQAARLVLQQVAAIAATGVAAGLLASYLLSPYIEELLYEVPARSPGLFITAAGVVAAAAAVATVGPLRRMLAVQPAEALRAD